MLSFNQPNWIGQILNNTASFKNNGNVGWLAGFWKKSLESNFIYLMRASACLTSGDMQYVDIRAITQSLCKSWCKVYVPTIMQYTETYSCDNIRTEREKKTLLSRALQSSCFLACLLQKLATQKSLANLAILYYICLKAFRLLFFSFPLVWDTKHFTTCLSVLWFNNNSHLLQEDVYSYTKICTHNVPKKRKQFRNDKTRQRIGEFNSFLLFIL